MTPFNDPGDQERRRGPRRPNVKAPEPASLFDITDQPSPTPMRVNSPTSVDAAKETRGPVVTMRRHMVLQLLRTTKPGMARFQIAEKVGVPDHWITSTVDALIKMRKIEEHKTLTVANPRSGKQCAVLVVIDSGEEVAA